MIRAFESESSLLPMRSFLTVVLVSLVAPVVTSDAIAQSRDPRSDLARFKRQIRDMILNEVTEPAIRNIEALLERHPKDAELHVLLGEAHFADDAFDEAVANFENGLALRPELRGRAFNLGRSYHELSRPKDALAVFDAMKKESSPVLRSKGCFGTGLVLEDAGREDDAEAAYREAIALDSKSYRPRYRLGLMLKDRNELAAAKDHFQFVLAAKPLHHGAVFNLSLVLLRLDEREAGEAMRARYLAILEGKQEIAGLKSQLVEKPKSWAILRALGDAYRKLESWSEAITWYRRARHENSWDAGIALGLAASYRGGGDVAEAERIYRELLKRTPPPRDAVEPLAEILEARGDAAEARALREKHGKG